MDSFIKDSGVRSFGYAVIALGAILLGLIFINEQFEFIDDATSYVGYLHVLAVFAGFSAVLLFVRDFPSEGIILLVTALIFLGNVPPFVGIMGVVVVIIAAILTVNKDQNNTIIGILAALAFGLFTLYEGGWIDAVVDNPAIVGVTAIILGVVSLCFMMFEMVSKKKDTSEY